MAVHKLILDDDFDEIEYALIAIHCTLEDYRLAYLLNKYLKITLSRKKLALDAENNNVSYAIYDCNDTKELVTWNLLSNICKTEITQKNENNSLFDIQQKIIKTTYLLPEYKTVNFFLKIDSEYHFEKENFILNKVLSIPQIATAYSIDPNRLKSKDNLIFS